jgi:hypothetical protein
LVMRRSLAFTSLSFVAGCATAPEPPPSQPLVAAPAAHIRGDLIGLTAGELVGRLGTPALQVREGNGLKLQFRAPRCILDAYLYPPPGAVGPERVTYVDARLRSGADTDQKHCVASIEGA